MKLSRIILFVTISLLVVLGVAAGLFALSKARTFQLFGGLTAHVETDKKVVALTFDDAPTEYVADVLKILDEKQVKGTFFAIGQAIEEHPDEARQIVEAGHQLGNHSYTHHRMVLKTPGFIKTEVEKTNELIRSAGYTEEIMFRPPNGKKLLGLPWYLYSQGIKTIMWDVEPDTYVQGDAQKIVDYTLSHTTPGSIILMHPFCSGLCAADREALPLIIDGLRQRGYSFVTVFELLKESK